MTNAVIHRLFERYKHCKTHAASGVIEGDQGVQTFTTAFARPDKFLFKWASTKPDGENYDCAVWSDGAETFEYYPYSGITTCESLSLAIAGATGVSQAIAPLIANLLFPNTAPSLTFSASEFEKEDCDDDSMFAYTAANKKADVSFWLESNSGNLLKMQFRAKPIPPEKMDELLAQAAGLSNSQVDFAQLRAELQKSPAFTQPTRLTTNVSFSSFSFDTDLLPESLSFVPSKD